MGRQLMPVIVGMRQMPSAQEGMHAGVAGKKWILFSPNALVLINQRAIAKIVVVTFAAWPPIPD